MKRIKDWFCADKSKIANALFFTALTIELLLMMLGHGAVDLPYRGRITHVAFVLFGCKTLLTKYTKKEWAVIFLLGLLGTVSYFAVGDEWVIRIAMMVVSSKDVALERIIKYAFFISLAGTLLIVALSLLGLGGPLTDVRDYGRGEVECRWRFGFNHANNMHGTVWYVVSLGLLAYVQKTKWQHYVLLTLGNAGLYLLTVSRTGFVVTQTVIVAALIVRYFPKMAGWKLLYLSGVPVTVFCVGVGMYMVAFGDYPINAWLWELSKLLTGRLEMIAWYEQLEYWTLWGNVRERVPLDVGYINLLANYGYVILFCYVAVTLLMIAAYCKARALLPFAVLMATVFYTFMESTYTLNVYLLCNFTFLLLLGSWNRYFLRAGNGDCHESV